MISFRIRCIICLTTQHVVDPSFPPTRINARFGPPTSSTLTSTAPNLLLAEKFALRCTVLATRDMRDCGTLMDVSILHDPVVAFIVPDTST